MKKFSVVFLVSVMLLLLSGCSDQDKNDPAVGRIEDNLWCMTTIQSAEQNGDVIVCGDTENLYFDVPVIDLCCTANQGMLTLTDNTNGETYIGTYKLNQSNKQSCIYSITLNDTEGMAVVSSTQYHDGTSIPTFIISLDDYALNFFPDNISQ